MRRRLRLLLPAQPPAGPAAGPGPGALARDGVRSAGQRLSEVGPRPVVVPPEERWTPAAAEPAARPVPWPGERSAGARPRRVHELAAEHRLRPATEPPADVPPTADSPGDDAWPGAAPEVAASDEDAASERRWSRLPGPGAFDPGRRGVRALAVVAAVVVLGAGFWAWRSRPQAEPVRAAASADAEAPAAGSEATERETPPSPGGSAGGELVVAVAGKVRRPGLVRVPAGARVADAVQAAGGALPGVDVALLNPARKVADGELILVGVTPPPNQPAAGTGQAAAPAGPGQPGGGPVNLNTATLAELDALPGVGPVLAQRILDHRERHGGFRSVSDLRQVEGIGDARYEQLKDLVTV